MVLMNKLLLLNMTDMIKTGTLFLFLAGYFSICLYSSDDKVRRGGMHEKTTMKKISIVRSSPFFNKDGLKYFKDSSCIYYTGNDYTIYQTPVHNFIEYVDIDSIASFETYNYYCVRKGEAKCLLYMKCFSAEPRFVSVDSLKKNGDLIYSFDVYPVYSIGTIISDSSFGLNKRIVRNLFPRQPGKDGYDTTIFYFDKDVSGIPLSFSKTLDSMYKSKLVEIKFIANETYSAELNMMVPRLITRFAMKYEEVNNKDSILYLIKRSKEYLK